MLDIEQVAEDTIIVREGDTLIVAGEEVTDADLYDPLCPLQVVKTYFTPLGSLSIVVPRRDKVSVTHIRGIGGSRIVKLGG